MKKLLLFIAGISILFLAGCYNGNQSHGNEGMGDSLPADPPLGYVIELKPLVPY
jgi:archaemetzincin